MNLSAPFPAKNKSYPSTAFYLLLLLLPFVFADFPLHARNNALTFGSSKYGQTGNGWSQLWQTPHKLTLTDSTRGKIEGVSAGESHTLLLTKENEVFGMGLNREGELGDGTTSAHLLPESILLVQELSGKTINLVSSRYKHAVLIADGFLFAWGSNSRGECGLGNKNTPETKPALVNTNGLLDGKKALLASTGSSFSIALDETQQLWSWGDNSHSQLGIGSLPHRDMATSPQRVNMTNIQGSAVKTISSGLSHTLLVTKEGSVFCWGSNSRHQCGVTSNGQTIDIPTLMDESPALKGKIIVDASAGAYHSVLLDQEGQVYVVGSNTAGQCAQCGSMHSDVVQAIQISLPSPSIHIKKVAAGEYHTVLLGSQSEVITFGACESGQCGTSNADAICTPSLVGDQILKDVPLVDISAGKSHSLILSADGDLYGMGDRQFLSPTDKFQTGKPFQVFDEQSEDNLSKFVSLAASDHTMIIESSKQMMLAFGRNDFSQLAADPSSTYKYQSVPVGANITNPLQEKHQIHSVALGYFHSIVISDNGLAFSIGRNHKGQLMLGDTENRDELTQINALILHGKKIVQGAAGELHTLLLDENGAVYCSGESSFGQCGVSTLHHILSPTLIDTSGELKDKTFTHVYAGKSHSLIMDSNGALYAFGLNKDHQLGIATDVQIQRVPMPIDMTGLSAEERVTSMCGGEDFSLLLTDQGAVYSFGSGFYGQTAQGNKETVKIPTRADGLLESKTIVRISCGGRHALAMDSTGTVFGWGDNQLSQLTTRPSSEEYELLPIELQLPSAALEIAAGHSHSVVLTEYKCEAHWHGEECSIPECHGIVANDEKVCSGRGTCVSYNKCTCEENYSGDNCEKSQYFYKDQTVIIASFIFGSVICIICVVVFGVWRVIVMRSRVSSDPETKAFIGTTNYDPTTADDFLNTEDDIMTDENLDFMGSEDAALISGGGGDHQMVSHRKVKQS